MKLLRYVPPIIVAIGVFTVGLITVFGPWRLQHPAIADLPRLDPLTFLAVVLAFLAYVAVAEEKLIKAVASKTPIGQFVRGAASYLFLVAGDFLLIVLSLELLRVVVPPSAVDVAANSYEYLIVTLVWWLAVGFASMHVFNWVRGLIHIVSVFAGWS